MLITANMDPADAAEALPHSTFQIRLETYADVDERLKRDVAIRRTASQC
ncbi:hypothetical protein [Krasilnikovia sp. M28-CT-15]